MAKIFFYGAVSLDGYLSDVNDGLQWLFDTEVGDKLTTDAFLDTVETVVMAELHTKRPESTSSLYIPVRMLWCLPIILISMSKKVLPYPRVQ